MYANFSSYTALEIQITFGGGSKWCLGLEGGRVNPDFSILPSLQWIFLWISVNVLKILGCPWGVNFGVLSRCYSANGKLGTLSGVDMDFVSFVVIKNKYIQSFSTPRRK